MIPSAREPETFAGPSRRQVLRVRAGLGVGSGVFQRALAAQASETATVTPEMIEQAEWIGGFDLAEDDRKAAARAVQQSLREFQALRAVPLDNGVPPALVFQPAAPEPARGERARQRPHGRWPRPRLAGRRRRPRLHARPRPGRPAPESPGVLHREKKGTHLLLL
jgi:hypothetical protein